MSEPKGSTERKPALKRYMTSSGVPVVETPDLPPAILTLTAPELRALAVFAEAMPELLAKAREADAEPHPYMRKLCRTAASRAAVPVMSAALAAAKEAE